MTTAEYEALLVELTPAAEKRLRSKHSLPTHDREEVLQDALIDLVRALERRPVVEPGALLSSIIDRRAADKARKLSRRANRETPAGSPDDLAALSTAPLTIEGNLFAADLDIAIRDLNEDDREAFILHDLRGVGWHEASRLLGVAPSTVARRTDRARKALREEL